MTSPNWIINGIQLELWFISIFISKHFLHTFPDSWKSRLRSQKLYFPSDTLQVALWHAWCSVLARKGVTVAVTAAKCTLLPSFLSNQHSTSACWPVTNTGSSCQKPGHLTTSPESDDVHSWIMEWVSESSSILRLSANSAVCYLMEWLHAKRFICLLCFDPSGWTLSLVRVQ